MTKDDLLWLSKWALAAVAGWWASLPQTVVTLLLFQAIDFATGLLRGSIKHELSSDASWTGLKKKIQMLLLVAAAHYAGDKIGAPVDLGSAAAIAYTVNEFISIIENVGQSGVYVPPAVLKLMKRFQKLRDGAEEDAVKP